MTLTVSIVSIVIASLFGICTRLFFDGSRLSVDNILFCVIMLSLLRDFYLLVLAQSPLLFCTRFPRVIVIIYLLASIYFGFRIGAMAVKAAYF
jgi:hypothetical protein